MKTIFPKTILSAVVCAFFAFSPAVFAADSPAKPATVLAPTASKTAPAAHDIVNINTADANTLAQLKGVGAKKAEAIIAFRKANGAFKSIDQFADVKGIGEKTLEANRKNIRI